MGRRPNQMWLQCASNPNADTKRWRGLCPCTESEASSRFGHSSRRLYMSRGTRPCVKWILSGASKVRLPSARSPSCNHRTLVLFTRTSLKQVPLATACARIFLVESVFREPPVVTRRGLATLDDVAVIKRHFELGRTQLVKWQMAGCSCEKPTETINRVEKDTHSGSHEHILVTNHAPVVRSSHALGSGSVVSFAM